MARAQAPVDPGRLDERLRPDRAPPPVGAVDVPSLPLQDGAPFTQLSFVLTGVRFEGAVSTPEEELQALAAPYLGREISLTDAFALAGAVTAEYRRRGLVLSRAIVPPQRIEDGVLTIQILEGYVDRATIEGDPGGYRPYLERYVTPVAAARPTSGDTLTRALLLAQDLQGAGVRAVIAPSATQPGAADLTLLVERDPVEAFIAADNRGSRWLGPVQLYAGVILNDLLGAGERIAATGVTAPAGGEMGFASLTYGQPLGGSGLRLDAFASYAETHPGDELKLLDLEGVSTTWGAGLQYPFLRGRDLNLIGRLTFIGRDSESANALLSPIFSDSTRMLSAELFVNHADRGGGLTSGSAAVTQGLDGLGATQDADMNTSRATGSAQFTRFNLEFSRVQPLFGRLYLNLRAAGQLTDDSLLAAEEFGVGGPWFGRAYDPSEITGDEGAAASVEAFYTLALRPFRAIEPYIYYEAGKVFQNDPLPGEPHHAALESAGIGARVSINGRAAASLEYAEPLNRRVASTGNRDGRVFFSLNAVF